MQSELIEQQLTPQELLDLKNKRTGLAIFQFSWILVFVCLMFVHWWMRGQALSWPPEGVEKHGIAVPTLMTAALIASSFLARRAKQAIKAHDLAVFRRNWQFTIALGLLFVVVMAVEWLAVPVSGQYSNLFRVLVGFHAVHAIAIGAYLIRVYQNAQAGQYDAAHCWPVEAAASLWYFVTIAWILFYIVLYGS
ncbi:MAG TPA: cytochrome c oxidase subunit 3 [Phototrophicaceae bacterium]|nr:cytochrome c oxidase subunit 3 [Phototrophicaceae bacterium]